MPDYQLQINELRPYFAELPYYLWGQVNYNSEGDCQNPTDRNWTWLELTNRETGEDLEIALKESLLTVSGNDPSAARVALFLIHRCQAEVQSADPLENVGDWDHAKALARAARVAAEFDNESLKPFAEGHWFWGSWKWIGWFGSDFTWVGRWIMDSVVRKDDRAVNLCVEWLREGPVGEPQTVALQLALEHLTGLTFASPQEWVHWYDSDGKAKYPEPNIDDWYEEMKTIHAIE